MVIVKPTIKQGNKIMQTLIAKLSKIDQRNLRVALMGVDRGCYKMLDSMIRSANNRSFPILTAIKAAL